VIDALVAAAMVHSVASTQPAPVDGFVIFA
jgi:hypothetical protein